VKKLGVEKVSALSLSARDKKPGFASLTDSEEVLWDYRRTSHSVRRHPLEPMRPALASQGLPDARTVASMKSGEKIKPRDVLSNNPIHSGSR
jgi:hypothetical protein